VILAIDVQYVGTDGYASAVLFNDWRDTAPSEIYNVKTSNVGEYQPGSFYKRELPCVLNLIERIEESFDTIVLDGFVYLDGKEKKGLGAHLAEHLNSRIKIIGVAKKTFVGLPDDHELYRGQSRKPLYVTSYGIGYKDAKSLIKSMAGLHRIPTLLKEVDRLCREYSKKHEN
jgi:deoxyribonuclease V